MWLRGQDSNLRLPAYETGGLTELSYRAMCFGVPPERFELPTLCV